MDPESNPNTDTAHSPAAPAPQPSNGSPQVTPEIQALIDAAKAEAAQQAKNAAWAEARRAFEGKSKANGGQQQPAHPSTQTQQPAGNGADPAQVYMRLRTFDRAVDKYGLTDSARAILEGDFNAANPQDPAAWVSQRAEAFGWKAAGAATPATPAPDVPAPKTAPQGPPVTGSGAPANPNTTITDDTPILRMSDADKVALRRRIGDVAFVERMRKEFKENNVRVKFR